ncbi:MAG: DNA repair protein RecN [Gammaproteobacteria bacterium]|nr:DNA repair protein RecN [Gammaproteobacteria bacterium]NIR82839.1 DNA repair protein RecN [Gammaproteobacteria bacterium]NIR89948.1 DNA repair protein RecN [Gammaproteobacteria bacterium]NIU03997.1 DNA repair protein RecN [Gammaproteobacteria bacterium]NIV51317.1 DNA repair protein RecN [Gammaproteobacteria bacterium]
MLIQLAVRDFAVVVSLHLELEPGMTVLTGETGAGKSILVDALSLALGERAYSDAVRAGRERAEVSAVFDLDAVPAARQWLFEHELDSSEGECVLRRSVGRDGRSRAWINTRPVPVQTLRELGDLLIDIHGQHAHQSLLRRATQRQILDEYAGHGRALARLGECYARWSSLHAERERLESTPGEVEARLDFLRYQLEELQRLNLEPDEPAQLDGEHRRMSHASELLQTYQQAVERLCGDDDAAVLSQIGGVRRSLGELHAYDERLPEPISLLESATVHVEEAASALRRYAEDLELDPQRYQWLEERLGAIHALARKHRVPAEELPALTPRLVAEVEALEHGAGRRESLEQELAAVGQQYREVARALFEERRRAADALCEAVSANMRELGMTGGRFQVRVEHAAEERPTPHGLDHVEFLVSTDPGQPMGPLARVASGGELSRISLAIQVIASQGSGVPTLVFDEVDAGIGGRVAQIVGQHLRRLAERRQVLCITHLPQVASQAAHHIQVQKYSEKAATRTQLEALSGEERVREIARMLGGLQITAQTLAHAREMLEGSCD